MKNIVRGIDVTAERQELLNIVRELRELQDKSRAKKGSAWGKDFKPIDDPFNNGHTLAHDSDMPDNWRGSGSFFSMVRHYSSKAYDMTGVLDEREKYILSGGLETYEYMAALVRGGMDQLAAMEQAFFGEDRESKPQKEALAPVLIVALSPQIRPHRCRFRR